jgi:hypothetical protein
MVHGLFRASGIVMIYRLHHMFSLTGRSVQIAWVISREQGWVILHERRSRRIPKGKK